MLVSRSTWLVKPGKVHEFRDAVYEEFKRFEQTHSVRVYAPYLGTQNVVMLEIEFASLQEGEAWWLEWMGSASDVFGEKVQSLREAPSSVEIWSLAE